MKKPKGKNKKKEKVEEYLGYKYLSQMYGFPKENCINANKELIKKFEFEIKHQIHDWGTELYLKTLKKELHKQIIQLN